MARYVHARTFFYILSILALWGVGFLGVYAATSSATTTVILTATVSPPEDEDPLPGGGGSEPVESPTEISFSGTAFPSADVFVLRDTQSFAQTTADVDSDFYVLKSDVTSGTYTFSIYGIDVYGTQTDAETYTITLASGARTEVKNIILSPSVKLSETVIDPGDSITIFGQAVQNSTVVLEFSGVGTTSTTTVSSVSNGQYEYVLDTTDMEIGEYMVRVKVQNNLIESEYSDGTSFTIGGAEEEEDSFLIGDVNYDDQVNIVDFSITAFWYEKTLSEAFTVIESERLNGDGVVDLRDFSLMAYYWTGS